MLIPQASSFFAYFPQHSPDSIPAAAPLSWGGIFPPSITHVFSNSFLLGAVIAPQEESPEHEENGHPFSSSGKYGLQSFWLQTPLQMTTCAHELSGHFLFSHLTIQFCFQREIWLLRVLEKSTITFYCSKSAGLLLD